MAIWRDNIRLIVDEEPVDDQIINRPLRQLVDRTQYLKDRQDAAATGEGLFLFSRVAHIDVSLGDAVYYNETTAQFERAIATVEDASSEDGSLRTADSAYVIGIVIRKPSSVTADILTYGYYPITLTNTDGADLAAGNHYLSATADGKLVSARPAVGVFVCTVTSNGIIVRPTPREVLEDHIHYRFELEVDPAGTAVCYGDDRVQIEFVDTDVEGWLPASHSLFNNTAPAFAKFGYNWWQNPALAAAFPPQPVGSAYIELAGVGVSADQVIVDDNGIWWMRDCSALVPWSDDGCASSSAAAEVESSSSAGPDAEPAPCSSMPTRLVLWFTKMVAKTDLAVVTGLKGITDSLIQVVGCNNPDAGGYCRGKVELDLTMDWSRETGVAGSEVVKGVLGNNRLQVGRVVEGISTSGLISVSGSQTAAGGSAAGVVTLTGLDPTSITRQIDVMLVALNGATESIYESTVPYVGLPSGRATSFTGSVRIPILAMTSPRVRLDIWIGMMGAGTPPANVTIAYAIINAAETTGMSSSSSLGVLAGSEFQTLPTADDFSTAVDLSLNDLEALTKGEYFNRRALDNLVIASEQILLFRLARSASDSYASELGIVKMVATVYDLG